MTGNTGGDAACGGNLGDNIYVDPLFCGPPEAADFSYWLHSISPCLGGVCGQMGAFGVGCTADPTENVTWGRLKAAYVE